MMDWFIGVPYYIGGLLIGALFMWIWLATSGRLIRKERAP